VSRDAVITRARQELAFWSALHHLAGKAVEEMLPASTSPEIVAAFRRVWTHAYAQQEHWREMVPVIPKPLARR
jgi:hypothetical protein